MEKESKLTAAGTKSERFRTAPGGGKNRASGGRIAAAAYVSPLTLPSEPLAKQPAQPFKIDTAIKKQVAQFGTQPSFFKSQEAPAAPVIRKRKSTLVVALIFFTLGASLAWSLSRYFAELKPSSSAVQPRGEKKMKNFGNKELEGPNAESSEDFQESNRLIDHPKSALGSKESLNKKRQAPSPLGNNRSQHAQSPSPEKKNEKPDNAKTPLDTEPHEPQVQHPSRELWLQ